MRTVRTLVLAVVGCAFWCATPAAAQSLGTFRFQLQPYCNVLAVTIVQQGAQYQLDGLDDQCGAAVVASVVGLAFQNPNGTLGFGLTVVTAPGGTAVHIDATIALPALSGPWRDSAGNSGTFVFTPGAGTGGAPRPVPASGLPPASITNAQIASGTIGAAQINTAQVQARVAGTCSANQAIAGVASNGSVTCLAVLPAQASITMTEPAGTFTRFLSVTTPTTAVAIGHLFIASGDGPIGIGLSPPPSVGGVQYQLSSVEYCIPQNPLFGAYVTTAVVYYDTPALSLTTAVSDPTDRTLAGCYTLAFPAFSARGYTLALALAGQTTSLTNAGIVVNNVRTTWVPVP